MLSRVIPKLYFSDENYCEQNNDGYLAIVHACQTPCYLRAVGGKILSSQHPNYLYLEDDYNLFLNLVDPYEPLFFLDSFEVALDFIDKHIKDLDVLIHCNMGLSRAPSLAMLYLAKRTDKLPSTSYEEAAVAFNKIHSYSPSRGISIFLDENWGELK